MSRLFRLLTLIAVSAAAVYGQRATLDLNGAWQFGLDPNDAGERERWFESKRALTDTIQVPGSWQAQGFGTASGNLRHHYVGKAWYKRTVKIPPEWKGRRVTLRIGGAMRFTTVFVNGQPGGRRESLNAPFEFDLTALVRPGEENTLALLVANPATAITESPDAQKATQPTGMLNYIANWGGIYGRVELVATEQTWIDDLLVVPDVEAKAATLRVRLRSTAQGTPYRARIQANVTGGPSETPRHASTEVEIRPGAGQRGGAAHCDPGRTVVDTRQPAPVYGRGIAGIIRRPRGR